MLPRPRDELLLCAKKFGDFLHDCNAKPVTALTWQGRAGRIGQAIASAIGQGGNLRRGQPFAVVFDLDNDSFISGTRPDR